MLHASCHCGAVEITLPEEPRKMTSCNCSVCRRLGTLWVYRHPDEVSFEKGAGTTVAYIWNDRTLEFHHCPTCGCITHWEPAKKEGAKRMAVNARLVDPEAIAEFELRHFDGANKL